MEIVSPVVNIANAHCHFIERPSVANAPEGPLNNRLVQIDQPVTIRFHWTQTSGSWVLPGGFWRLECYLEDLGPTENSGYFFIDVAGDGTNGFKQQDLNIPAGSIPPGVYDVTCAMQFWQGGNPKALAGFDSMGKYRFYRETP